MDEPTAAKHEARMLDDFEDPSNGSSQAKSYKKLKKLKKSSYSKKLDVEVEALIWRRNKVLTQQIYYEEKTEETSFNKYEEKIQKKRYPG